MSLRQTNSTPIESVRHKSPSPRRLGEVSTRLVIVGFLLNVVLLILSSDSEPSLSDEDMVLKSRICFKRGLSVAREDVVKATPISTVLQIPRSMVV